VDSQFQVCTNVVAVPSWGFAQVAIRFAPKCVSLGPWFADLVLRRPGTQLQVSVPLVGFGNASTVHFATALEFGEGSIL
jgi:hypothetical protein